MDHQTASGCRGCANGSGMLFIARRSSRCARRAGTDAAIGRVKQPIALLLKRACEGDETLSQAPRLGYQPVVSPKSNRCLPWQYDGLLYWRRNELDRLLRRLKRYRRVFTRYDTLNIIFKSSHCICSVRRRHPLVLTQSGTVATQINRSNGGGDRSGVRERR